MTTTTLALLLSAGGILAIGGVVWQALPPAPRTELVATDPAGTERIIDRYETERDCRLFEQNRPFQVNVLGVKAAERVECRAAK